MVSSSKDGSSWIAWFKSLFGNTHTQTSLQLCIRCVLLCVCSTRGSVRLSAIVSSLNSSSLHHQFVSGEVSGTFLTRSYFRIVISARMLLVSSPVFPPLLSFCFLIGRCPSLLIGWIAGRHSSCCLKTLYSLC